MGEDLRANDMTRVWLLYRLEKGVFTREIAAQLYGTRTGKQEESSIRRKKTLAAGPLGSGKKKRKAREARLRRKEKGAAGWG